MRVKIINQDRTLHSWSKIYPELLKEAGHEVVEDKPDWVMNMWTSDYGIKEHPEAKHIMFMRRYEVFTVNWSKYDWSKVKHLILVNDWFRDVVKKYLKDVDTHVIYNSVKLDNWTFKRRSHGKKIAMVSFVNPKKNIPMALQIMNKLGSEYELHIAGDVQDQFLLCYIGIMSLIMKKNIFFHNYIPNNELDAWLEDKNYLLSTSYTEGCPNNVIEAMAKGIKPIVHYYPGIEHQFGPYAFETIDDAIKMFSSEYNSEEYLNHVINKFSLDNYRKVISFIK